MINVKERFIYIDGKLFQRNKTAIIKDHLVQNVRTVIFKARLIRGFILLTD